MAILPMFLLGCSDNFSEQENHNHPINGNRQDLIAMFADVTTRTYVENDKYLRWHEDDRLSVFYGSTLNDQYKFKGQTGDNSGTFALVPSGELGTGNTLPNIYAIYPYNADARITDDGVIIYSFSATQNYAENSFAKDANTMVAVTNGTSDTFLSFRNVCGYLKLKLYGDATIKSIEVKGNFGEKIAGNATITATYGEVPMLEMSNNATQTITLDCGDGVTLGRTEEDATLFWIVIPETIFKYGITITATSVDNKVFSKSTSNSIVIERNVPLPMSALEFVGEDNEITPIASSTIVYTTDDDNIVDLYTTEGFGAEYVSNVYDAVNNIGTITFNGEITSIPAEAFLVCTNLTSVQIPNTVTTIAEKAFYGCNYMETIIIPESVTYIAETAFEGCAGEAYISCDVNDNAFVGALFTKVVMDDNVTSIGKESFMDCIRLKNVTLSKNLTTIPYCAFQNTAIEDITIPEGVVALEDGAFYQCSKLKTATLPESVNTLGTHTFYGCVSLKGVKMPSRLTSIGREAFRNCSSLEEIIIPEGVSSLEIYTFHECSNLSCVSLPSTLTSMKCSFYNCDKLTRLNLADINAWLKIDITSSESYLGGEAPFEGSEYGDIYVNGKLLTELVIPNDITKIGAYSFYNVKSLISVKFGSRVVEIGNCAFNGCSNIANFEFPKSLIKVGIASFARTGIADLTLTPVLANSRFYGCENLVNLTIPEGTEKLISMQFNGCTSLKEVKIPNSVKSIDSEAFANCINLTNIDIPDGVTSISDAFRGCSSLTSFKIPNSVSYIEAYAFKDCINLTSLYIPSSVVEINESANSPISGCTNLKYIYLMHLTPPKECFYVPYPMKYADFTVYVQATNDDSVINAYKNSDKWNKFAIEEYDFAE